MKLGILAVAGAVAVLGAAGIGLTFGGADETRVVDPAGTTQAPEAPGARVVPAAQGGLGLPIACTPGQDCQIQNYVDHDAGPGALDPRCGTRTYDAHNGTDFRVLDEAARLRGVSVLAAADGVVLRVRDGVPDVSVVERGLGAVAGQECGNGLVLDHGAGLTTQYCHLGNGSVRVAPGQAVRAGEAIGSVGMSGQSEYPHLHFTVRQGETVVDPFAPAMAGGPCRPATGPSLWSVAAAGSMAYRSRVVLNAGFAGVEPSMASIEAGGLSEPTRTAPVLVAYVRALGLKAGDVERLTVTGPDGQGLATATNDPLASNRAQQMIFAGRRLRGDGWPAGRYGAIYRVEADGVIVLEHRFGFTP